MSDQKETVDKMKHKANKAQAAAKDYATEFAKGTQYPIAKFFSRLLGILGIILIVVGLFSLLKGVFTDSRSMFGSASASVRFGPGLAMMFFGALGGALASGLDIVRDSADRDIKTKK